MTKILALIFMLSFYSISYGAGKLIDYQLNNEQYEGYFITGNGDAPFILLVHDWNGLTDYEIKRVEMLGDLGYSVFAADLFGKGIRPTEVKDKRQHTGELYNDRIKMRALMIAAMKVAKEHGANIDNGVAMGYCFGGTAILELARSGADLKVYASFHGGLSTPGGQDYSQTSGSVMIFHGAADTAITMMDFARLAEELEQAGVKNEMISYGGAPHAFTHFGGDRYHKDADEQSWLRYKNFLKEVLE